MRPFKTFFVLFSFLLFPTFLQAQEGPVSAVSADSALLFDTTGQLKYYAKNIHDKVLPASTVKIMTAIIILERMRLDDVVTVSWNADDVPPTKIGIKPGEKYTVRDLLYAALVNSANDAATALAEAAAGSEKRFVEWMNQKARELGARNTVFANAHGLLTGGDQHTTAYDMYLIFYEAFKNPFFRRAMRTREMTISSQEGRSITFETQNKALFKGWKKNVYGKTGYIHESKACFVGWVPKGEDILIIAVFGSDHRWEDIQYILEQYGKIDL